MHPEIELDLLGPLTLRVAGKEQSLPASRKTRALLAYLAVSGRPERRERLCDLFWEVPDDPRGALRWSLSKLRGLVDTGDVKRLKADREFVQLDIPDASVDWRRLRALVRRGTESASIEDLRAVALAGTFLEGLDLAGCEAFDAWCIAQREDVRVWRIAVLDDLTARPIDVDEAIGYARAWTMLDPHAAKPWERLVGLLRGSERSHEAEQQRGLAIKVLAEAGRPVPASLARAPQSVPILRREPTGRPAALPQKLRFCRSADGVRLAFSSIGEGTPLVRAGFWMNHLENDLTSPVWRPWIDAMSEGRMLVRYDARGFGLSDRDVDLDVERSLPDLEAVVDAAELDRFDLYGMAQGAVTAVMYAARHPQRVRRLVLQSSYALGWSRRNRTAEVERRKALITLATRGWKQSNEGMRSMFLGLYLPSADAEQANWFDEFFQSMMVHPNVEPLQRLLGEVDVTGIAENVIAPTLVLHPRGEMIIPLAAGREMAMLITDARLVVLDTSSHLVVPGEPAWEQMIESVNEFLE